jgi:hypothetical protein
MKEALVWTETPSEQVLFLHLSVGRGRERHLGAVSTGWFFLNIMAHPLLGEEDSTSPPRWL